MAITRREGCSEHMEPQVRYSILSDMRLVIIDQVQFVRQGVAKHVRIKKVSKFVALSQLSIVCLGNKYLDPSAAGESTYI